MKDLKIGKSYAYTGGAVNTVFVYGGRDRLGQSLFYENGNRKNRLCLYGGDVKDWIEEL